MDREEPGEEGGGNGKSTCGETGEDAGGIAVAEEEPVDAEGEEGG